MDNRRERIFDALLGIAAEETLEQEMGAMPGNEALNRIYRPSKRLNRKVRRIIAKHEYLQRAKIYLIPFLIISVAVIFGVKGYWDTKKRRET